MEASDLANYREQVAAIEQALKDDPQNEELVGVRTELLELISLTETILLQQQPSATVDENVLKSDSPAVPAVSAASSASPMSASASPASPAHMLTSTSITTPTTSSTSSSTRTPTSAEAAAAAAAASRPVFEEFLPHHKRLQQAQDRVWSVGDRCRALYEGDSKFYEAIILAVGQHGDLFSVEFKGYESSPPSLVRKQDLRSSHEHNHKKRRPESDESAAGTTTGAGAAATATATATAESAGDRADSTSSSKPTTTTGGVVPKKKKVNKTEEEVQERIQKQNAWKNFAAKGKKTGMLGKKSMFASPDGPQGKVGVVGSGKGMTQFHQRGKHVYNPDD
ncbi:hypothetical protein DFQ26_004655 [Actinomortierella ambigua]|nr:hypothetical protein DFQ26_004655 [Actinomortierella ambigua]